MSSAPKDHDLFEGNRGAAKWLERFLALLPAKPQSPLPLLTAPVLDAFLTGAGHMLANKHEDTFQKHLRLITEDILPRLDESSIGKPSATRFKQLVARGIVGFKTTLPSKAIPQLYYGASPVNPLASSLPQGSSVSNPFGAGRTNIGGSAFGQEKQNLVANPFIAAGSSSNPFGTSQQYQTTGSSSFNQFGISQPIATFSQPGNINSGMSSFSSNPLGASVANPFGLPATGSSQFNPSTTNPSSFGQTTLNSANPFGFPAPAPTPFGNSTLAASNPFGGPPSLANPFQRVPGESSNASGSFQASEQGQIQPRKKNQVCKYFLQGRCNRGANCAYSHIVSNSNVGTRSDNANTWSVTNPFGRS
jgi:hypothetical protein